MDLLQKLGLKKARRSIIAEYVYTAPPQIREPEYNYSTLLKIAEESHILRTIIRAIIESCMSPGWEVRQKFIVKCTVCGAYFDKYIDRCERCGSEVKKPDLIQLQRLEKLLMKPNPQDSFDKILNAMFYYDLVCDDYFISIIYDYVPSNNGFKKVAREIWAEDPSTIKIVADQRGRLGKDEYFCPLDEDVKSYIDKSTAEKQGFKCKTHKIPLEKTCYIQEVNGNITARFSEDMMIHGSSMRKPPSLYGSSRLIAGAKLAKIIDAMDDFNYEVHTKGHIASMILCEGMTQQDIDTLKAQMEAELQKRTTVDYITGKVQPSKAVYTLLLSTGERGKINRVSLTEDFRYIRSIEFYRLYLERLAALYGVTPVFVNINEPGRTGTSPRIQIEVQNRTILEHQREKEAILNDKLLPIFGIYDYEFKFKALEAKNLLLEHQMAQIQAQTARVWVDAGFDVELDEWGNLKVKGKGRRRDEVKRGRPRSAAPAARAPRKPAISERTGALIAKPESEYSLETKLDNYSE